MRTCAECGGSMEGKQRNARYCSRACYLVVYNRENREKSRQWHAEWRKANPERAKKYQRDHYHRNREARKAAHRERYPPERMREYQRAWRAANREKTREYCRRWYERHPDVVLAKSVRRRTAMVELVDIDDIYMRDEGRCGICGHLVNPQDFHIDHIVPIVRGGKHEADNVQIAHPFCNLSKGSKLPEEMAA